MFKLLISKKNANQLKWGKSLLGDILEYLRLAHPNKKIERALSFKGMKLVIGKDEKDRAKKNNFAPQ